MSAENGKKPLLEQILVLESGNSSASEERGQIDAGLQELFANLGRSIPVEYYPTPESLHKGVQDTVAKGGDALEKRVQVILPLTHDRHKKKGDGVTVEYDKLRSPDLSGVYVAVVGDVEKIRMKRERNGVKKRIAAHLSQRNPQDVGVEGGPKLLIMKNYSDLSAAIRAGGPFKISREVVPDVVVESERAVREDDVTREVDVRALVAKSADSDGRRSDSGLSHDELFDDSVVGGADDSKAAVPLTRTVDRTFDIASYEFDDKSLRDVLILGFATEDPKKDFRTEFDTLRDAVPGYRIHITDEDIGVRVHLDSFRRNLGDIASRLGGFHRILLGTQVRDDQGVIQEMMNLDEVVKILSGTLADDGKLGLIYESNTYEADIVNLAAQGLLGKLTCLPVEAGPETDNETIRKALNRRRGEAVKELLVKPSAELRGAYSELQEMNLSEITLPAKRASSFDVPSPADMIPRDDSPYSKISDGEMGSIIEQDTFPSDPISERQKEDYKRLLERYPVSERPSIRSAVRDAIPGLSAAGGEQKYFWEHVGVFADESVTLPSSGSLAAILGKYIPGMFEKDSSHYGNFHDFAKLCVAESTKGGLEYLNKGLELAKAQSKNYWGPIGRLLAGAAGVSVGSADDDVLAVLNLMVGGERKIPEERWNQYMDDVADRCDSELGGWTRMHDVAKNVSDEYLDDETGVKENKALVPVGDVQRDGDLLPPQPDSVLQEQGIDPKTYLVKVAGQPKEIRGGGKSDSDIDAYDGSGPLEGVEGGVIAVQRSADGAMPAEYKGDELDDIVETAPPPTPGDAVGGSEDYLQHAKGEPVPGGASYSGSGDAVVGGDALDSVPLKTCSADEALEKAAAASPVSEVSGRVPGDYAGKASGTQSDVAGEMDVQDGDIISSDAGDAGSVDDSYSGGVDTMKDDNTANGGSPSATRPGYEPAPAALSGAPTRFPEPGAVPSPAPQAPQLDAPPGEADSTPELEAMAGSIDDAVEAAVSGEADSGAGDYTQHAKPEPTPEPEPEPAPVPEPKPLPEPEPEPKPEPKLVPADDDGDKGGKDDGYIPSPAPVPAPAAPLPAAPASGDKKRSILPWAIGGSAAALALIVAAFYAGSARRTDSAEDVYNRQVSSMSREFAHLSKGLKADLAEMYAPNDVENGDVEGYRRHADLLDRYVKLHGGLDDAASEREAIGLSIDELEERIAIVEPFGNKIDSLTKRVTDLERQYQHAPSKTSGVDAGPYAGDAGVGGVGDAAVGDAGPRTDGNQVVQEPAKVDAGQPAVEEIAPAPTKAKKRSVWTRHKLGRSRHQNKQYGGSKRHYPLDSKMIDGHQLGAGGPGYRHGRGYRGPGAP